jgi:hypothetical protein
VNSCLSQSALNAPVLNKLSILQVARYNSLFLQHFLGHFSEIFHVVFTVTFLTHVAVFQSEAASFMPNLNLENQGLPSILPLTFHLSGMSDSTRSLCFR